MANGVTIWPGFLNTLGIPFLRGHGFQLTDDAKHPHVAIFSESLAERLFPRGDAVGQHVRYSFWPEFQNLEIVGVAEDARIFDLRDATQVVASFRDGATGEPIHNRRWDNTVMDVPVVNRKQQRRPSLRANAIGQLVQNSEGDEQALYVLLGATGMRISEALAVQTKHFVNDGRTIQVREQVDHDRPRIVTYLKTDAAYRDIDLHPDVAEYLRAFISGKDGLLFKTRNGTPHLHNNIEDRWLTERLKAMKLDEPGMGWHAFRRFRETRLRGERCQADINVFWMGHEPETMSELYSHLFEELEKRLAEAERVGVGFVVPAHVAPSCSKKSLESEVEVAA